jgi:repressor LexA
MARPLSTALSKVHRKILKAVAVLERRGFPASIAELIEHFKLAGNASLLPTLRIMQRNGFLLLHGGGKQGRRQAVKLTPKGKFALALGGLPFLGTIPAGPLDEAIANAAILDERELLSFREGDFLLQVKGDSMVGDGILPGDKVLLRPNVEPHDGEIAAVIVGSEATLKRVYFQAGKMILRASNPAYPDMVVKEGDVRVAGVFRGLVRDANR